MSQINSQSNRYLRLPEVINRTGLSKDSIYRLGKKGTFPKPIKLGERASAWPECEVIAALDARKAERDARS